MRTVLFVVVWSGLIGAVVLGVFLVRRALRLFRDGRASFAQAVWLLIVPLAMIAAVLASALTGKLPFTPGQINADGTISPR